MIRRDFTRSQSRNYAGPRLRNPFFAHAPNRFVRLAVIFVVFAVPLALLVVGTFAPFMRYNDVRIDGLTTLSADDVRAVVDEQLRHRSALVIPGNHIILGRHDAIVGSLTECFQFSSIIIERQGRALHIVVKERISEVAWRTGEKTYLLDLEGMVVQEASTDVATTIRARETQANDIPRAAGLQPTMPILVNEAAEDAVVGATVLSKEMLEDVLELDEALRLRSLLPVRYLFTDVHAPWLTVETVGGPSLLFDIAAGEPGSALGYLDAYTAENRAELPGILYIDLRFDNHIYTKLRSL